MESKICVTLDSLLDTRLGTLNEVNIHSTIDILKTYHRRQKDDFDVSSKGLIDIEEYKAAYSNRDVETLKGSYRTAIMDFISKLVIQTNLGPWESTAVIVNVYPYVLDKEETEAILGIIGEELPGVEVRAISISNEMLTPRMLDDWECYIAYDFLEWLQLQGDAIADTGIGDTRIKTTCYYPMLIHNEGKYTDENGNALEPSVIEEINSRNPWDSLELLYSSHLAIKALPVSFFSATPHQERA